MKIPTDLKDVKAIREFLTNIRTQVCGMVDFLSEPWKTHFNDLKKHYDDALAALPPTDQVAGALEANNHLSCFYSCRANANALANRLGSALDGMHPCQIQLNWWTSGGVKTAGSKYNHSPGQRGVHA